MNKPKQISQLEQTVLSVYATQNAQGEYEVEKDVSEIKKSINLVEMLFPNLAIMLCLLHHPGTPYVSSNSKGILGYSPEQLMNLNPDDFFGLIHLEDLPPVKQAYQYLKTFVTNHRECDPEQYRFAIHYRLRQPNGQYIYLQDEKIAIRNPHNRYVFFMLYKDVSQERQFTRVQLEIFRFQQHELVKIMEYVPQTEDKTITPREKEIIRLIGVGLSSQEISRQLSISIHTVKNHRRNLFRKAKVRNSLGLLLVAQQSKWI
jgi:DNA-binding CsgD family transcriptional regulator